ncbi:alpha/beta fold hydrolase [Albirhodobacter sp. R86504]|jgi:3-oxoadipate enol-lactonase|uniref:alpha/beta fold hydrolase n=1 Tax=Albirhodobacter sp. R86504 TaxID=3093848 RepID=UPI00366D2F54
MTAPTLYSTVSGREDAPALLLMNSFGATQAMWDLQMPLLEAHYRVIRFDARGHGKSPTPPSPYTFDELVADAIGVLDRYDAKTASVMGVSMGGMTALGMALRSPDRITRAVCCAARADAPEGFVQNWHNRMGILAEGGIEAVWNATAGMWLGDHQRGLHPEYEAALRDGFLQTTDEGYRGGAHALIGLDYLQHLGAMTVPVLFVAGAQDAAAPPEVMRAMAQACPGSEFTIVPEAKHILNVDRPSDFEVAITDFLKLEAH